MTQNSNHNAYVPWGEPDSPASTAPLMALVSVPALLAHIVIMLTASSVLTLVNLLTTPRVWWSFAILAIWFAVVIIHAIGLASRSLLLDEEDVAPVAAPRAREGTHGPPVPGWLNLPRRDRGGDASVPSAWELSGDGTASSWPEQPAAPQQASEPPAPPERVPWRAATDIAWLRRPARGNGADAGDDESRTSKEASS